ncbi:hypothetical protein Aduo_015889 [Ancylostoma duodenale]
MWGFVHFPESNDYCVLKSTQVHKGRFAVGETVSVLYNAKVLYVNPSKSLCDKECRKLLSSKDCRKQLSTDSDDSLGFDGALQSEKPPRSGSPCIQELTDCNSSDSVLYAINQLSALFQSQLDNIREELIQLDAQSSTANLKLAKMEQSFYTVKSSLHEILERVPPPPEAPKALTYPYRLSKERSDDIQKSTTSVTHFTRVAERELFAEDSDRHLNIGERVSQDKVRWLREMIKYRFPSQTPGAEATTWAACVRAINSYHRRRRPVSPLHSLGHTSLNQERIFFPPRTAKHVEQQASAGSNECNSIYNLYSGSLNSDAEMYDFSE